MISRAWHGTIKFLGSSLVATLLLVFLGAWSVLASFVPQVPVSAAKVAIWAATHPLLEPVVRVFGLHNAFTAPLFLVGILLLAACTTLCAWERTKFAVTKSRILRTTSGAGKQSVVDKHDFEIDCDPGLSESDILSVAAGTLTSIGIRTKREDDVIVSASASWTVWGSPLFHWALLLLVLVVAFGSLQRASGQMGLAVGESKVDSPPSYGIISAGPLHGWGATKRSIRLDAFDRHYETGGLDRGPTPSVSVLDAQGKVVKSQHVYPNKTLKTGSLTIYPSDWGLSARVVLLNAAGVETGRTSRLVDFSADTTEGTRAVGHITINDETGNTSLKVFITVPLDRDGNVGLKRVPSEPKARIVVASMDNKVLLDRVLTPGQGLKLPVGGTLGLVEVGYYARLQLVDDASIPLLYLAFVLATIGLSMATLARQQIVQATVLDTSDGAKLAVRVRLWRNVTTSRSEIENELGKALHGVEEESDT